MTPRPARGNADDTGAIDRIKIGAAIEEVLRGVPSSFPPPPLADTRKVPPAVLPHLQNEDPEPTQRFATKPVETTQLLGVIPPAPAPRVTD